MTNVDHAPNAHIRQAVRRYLESPLPADIESAFRDAFPTEQCVARAVRQGRHLMIADVLTVVEDFLDGAAQAGERFERSRPPVEAIAHVLFGTTDPADVASAVDDRVIRHRNLRAVFTSMVALAGDSHLASSEVVRHRHNLSLAGEVIGRTQCAFAPSDRIEFIEQKNSACTAGLRFAETRLNRITALLNGPRR